MPYLVGKLKDRLALVLGQANNKCMVCDVDIFDDFLGFCDSCFAKCTLNSGKTCLRCGTAIEGDEDFCGSCNFDQIFLDKAYSAFVYEGELVKVFYAIKLGGIMPYCRMLATYLVFLVQKHKIEFDTVCYVPMTAKKVRERGFNQAEVLAKYFCDFLQVECLSHPLAKVRNNVQQEKLNKHERHENVKNAFKLVDNSDIKGKTVLLIDDVKTTGATLNECARMLKKGGAGRVVCATVASRKQTLQSE